MLNLSNIQSVLRRSLKILLWILFGLLFLTILLQLLIHLPPVQRMAAEKASSYLSNTINGKVTIDRIKVFILKELEVKGIEVYDPNGKSILSSQSVVTRFNIIDLLSGNLAFQEVQVEGFRGQLVKTEQGLNIQYIIESFNPSENTPSNDPNPFDISIDRIRLHDVHLKYKSPIDSIEIEANIGILDLDNSRLAMTPNLIRIHRINLEKTTLNILSYKKDNQPPTDSISLPPLDFNTGFDIEINQLAMNENSFIFHNGDIKESKKFDPHHLELTDIQFDLSKLLIRNDSLSLELSHFSTALQGFSLDEVKTRLHVNKNQFILSDLWLSSTDSELRGDLTATFESWSNLLNDLDRVSIDLSMAIDIQPDQFRYFIPDSVFAPFEDWPMSAVEIIGKYSLGNFEMEKVNILALESQLSVTGEVGNLMNPDSIFWNDIIINTKFGPSFGSLVAPYNDDFKLPPDLHIQLLSSGNLKSFDLESKIKSAAGTVSSSGKVGLNQHGVEVDLVLDVEKFAPGPFMGLPWLGQMDLSVHIFGNQNSESGLEFEGQIEQIEIAETNLRTIDLQGNFGVESLDVSIFIKDPDFGSHLESQVQFQESLRITNRLQLHDFKMGKLLYRDSSLLVSGDFNSTVSIDSPSIEGFFRGRDISFQTDSNSYLMDSLALNFMVTATESNIDLYSDHIEGRLVANFDIQQGPELVENLFRNYWGLIDSVQYKPKDKRFSFDFEVKNAALLQLFDQNIKELSALRFSGKFDEYDQTMEVKAGIHKFNGFGISLDTLQAVFSLQHSINSNLRVENIFYDDLKIGNLDFNILTKQDSAYSNLVLSRDSVTVLGITSHFQPTQNGIYIYLDSFISFDEEYNIDRNNSVFLGDNNLLFEHLIVSKDDFEMVIDGDLSRFDLSVNNADLRNLNYLIAPDSTVIHSGILDGMVSYNKTVRQINVKAVIDSLTYKNSPPINISAKVVTEETSVPIEFSLRSATNNIELAGDYFVDNSEIDALLEVDINNLEIFQFLFSDRIDEIDGRVHGKTKITGTLQNPSYQGRLNFQDVVLTTTKPRSTFQLKDEVITLDNSGITLYDFTIYDQRENPLTLNGALITKDYQSFEYDLTLDTDDYLLLNNPVTEEYPLQGILVVGTNLKITGNEKDTYVEAQIIIKDTTELTYVTPQENLELLTSDGIVEFIDPEHATDSIRIAQNQSFYDSLISTLPNFDLTSAITLEDQAVFRVIVDARSGDYIEASGAADLKLSFDRTGNVQLTGNYSISKGYYQLSFYNIVKKKFTIAPGSTVNWTGNPNSGDLDIIALYSITTSSIGLIGHEIGESEKALYRKSLPYEVGIVITGSIESPQISFSLDLPEDEKINYPALASKLDRFKQPEFESELNTQVFGLLVLGGFIPESSGSNFDQSLIATTTLSNSVNSILASQFNRLASQIIKGVDINVGLQTYSDYTGGVAQTRTAMDFKVTKRLMDDRLSIELGGGVDINSDQSGVNTGGDSFRGDITVIYDLTDSGSKQLKVFNNETYDIIYHEVRNTGISLIFIREFDKEDKKIK